MFTIALCIVLTYIRNVVMSEVQFLKMSLMFVTDADDDADIGEISAADI